MNTKARIVFEGDDKTRSAVDSVKKGLDTVQSRAEAVGAVMASTFGVALTGTLLGFAASVRAGINELDRLDETAGKIGISAEKLTQYGYAARMAGASNEALEKGIVALSQKMAEENKVFDTLGIKVKAANGQLRDTDSVMQELADKFASYADGPAKVALANELMGKSGKELIPFLSQGSEGLRKMSAEAKALGLAFGQDATRQAGEYKDNIDRITTAVDGAAIAMAQRMLPGLIQVTDAMVAGAKQGGVLQGIWRGLAEFAAIGFGTDQLGKEISRTQELAYEMKRLGDEVDKQVAILERDPDNTAAQRRLDTLSKKLSGVQKEALAASDSLKRALNPGFDNEPSFQTLEDRRLGRRTKEQAPTVAKPATAATESEYSKLIKRIQEKIALDEQQLATGGVLTEFEKFRIKTLEEMNDARKKLTDEEKSAVVTALWLAEAADNAVRVQKSEFDQAMDIAKARQKLREDEYKAGQETVRQALEDSTARNRIARETLENIQFETSLLGLNTREREQAVAMRELERQGIRQGTEAWDLYAQAIQQAVASRSGIQQGIDDFSRLWAELDSTGRDTFRSIGDSWKGTVQRMKDTAKNTLFDYLYQVAARPILFKLAAQFSGAPASAVQSVAGQVFGGGGNNILTNLISGADFLNKGGIAGLGSLFGGGGATVSTAAQLGAGLEGFLGGSGVFASAGGTSAGLLGAAGTALPWVGGALLLGSLFDKKRGGPKTIGGAEEAGNIQAGIQSMLAQFGASTAGLRVGGFSAADPQGTSLTQLQTALFSGDRALYSRQDRVGDYENVGRSQEELAAAWAEETARITLAALQARLGPQYQQYLDGLDANTSSVDDINAGLTRVNQARALEARLLELTSTEEQKLAEARRQERATFGPTLQGLLDRIYAEQDLQREAAATTSVLDRRAEALAYATSIEDAALSALGRAIEKERTALQAQRDAAAERVAEISGVFSTVSDAVRDLWAQTAATSAMAAREGNSLIAGALAAAKTTGYLPSQASLAEAIGAVRGGIAATPYASERERAFDQLVLASQLNQLKTISGSQLTEAERSLDVAEEQLSQLQRTYDTAREQLEATRTGTLTIAQALAGVQAALQGAAAVRGAAPGGRPATPVTDAEIAAWVVPRAGVSEAANMALYNDALANRDRGVTLAKIDEAAGLPPGTSAAWAIANGKQLFATGAAFTNGVVTRPTAFDIGVMGEGQDPEGILPLTNVGGRLGVDARTNNAEIVAALRTNSTAIESLGKRLDGIQAATERTAAALTGQQKIPLLVEVVTEE